MFQKNVGSTDKIIRLIIALILIALVVTDVVSGTWMYVAIAAAAIMLVSSLINFCPLYLLFKGNTCKVKK